MLIGGKVGETEHKPAEPTLVYDGGCDFCVRWVRRVRRWDRAGVVRYLPLQDALAPAVAGRCRPELQRAAHLVRPDGAVYAGAAATRELLWYLPGGWILCTVMGIPGVMPLAERLYAWIARRWGPVP